MRLFPIAFVALAAAASGLSGCMTYNENEPSVWRDDITTPVERQIRLDVNEATHILRATSKGLGRAEAARLGAFLAAQGRPWSMDVRLQPLSRRGAAALDDAEVALVQLGVQPARISRAARGERAGDGDIAVMARNVKASAVGCPDWRRANLMDLSELNSSNFGCATADNLARMIADPRELSTGRALAPAVGANAAAAVNRYRSDQVKKLKGRSEGGAAGGGGGGGGGDSK